MVRALLRWLEIPKKKRKCQVLKHTNIISVIPPKNRLAVIINDSVVLSEVGPDGQKTFSDWCLNPGSSEVEFFVRNVLAADLFSQANDVIIHEPEGDCFQLQLWLFHFIFKACIKYHWYIWDVLWDYRVWNSCCMTEDFTNRKLSMFDHSSGWISV